MNPMFMVKVSEIGIFLLSLHVHVICEFDEPVCVVVFSISAIDSLILFNNVKHGDI